MQYTVKPVLTNPLIEPPFCVQNRQVFGFKQIKLTKIFFFRTSFKVRFIEDSGLFKLLFNQIDFTVNKSGKKHYIRN